MTEKQLRKKVADTALSYVGTKEGDIRHHSLVDTYNSHKPLARGYKLKYTDAWCAGFASAIAIICGTTDVAPTEVGVGEMVKKFQALGTWQENDAYTPQPGDYIVYDWQDTGAGDNTGWPDHIGIVTDVTGTTITVCEGNYNDAVGTRKISINARYIRGYCTPDYASLCATDNAPYDVLLAAGIIMPERNNYITADVFANALRGLGII